MPKVFDGKIILQNALWDWQNKLKDSNGKDVLIMIKRKVKQIEMMEKSPNFKIRWI